MALTFSAASHASQWGLGMMKESWTNVDLDASANPKWPSDKEPGWSHLKFSIPDITTYFLDEPGLIFGTISGMAETEANRINARNQAVKDGSLTYSYAYGQPAPIPTGRWNRWQWATGKSQGAMANVSGGAASYDPNITFEYLRINMDIITAPVPFGDSGFYWMPSGEIYGRSLKIYGATPGRYTNAPSGPASDFSTLGVPFNFHLGYQPKFFPWFQIEGQAGWDFVSWGLFALASMDAKDGMKNYTHGIDYGGTASLGVDWFNIFYRYAHRVEPLWSYEGYARRYEGDMTSIGARLDLGVALYRLFAKD